MVAKNLLAFVGVGILSGLLLGIYLLETKDGYFGSKITTMADGPAISIIPTATIFDEGEQVTFRIINSGSMPLYSEKGDVYGATITGLAGILIYTFDMQDIMIQQTRQDSLQEMLNSDMQEMLNSDMQEMLNSDMQEMLNSDMQRSLENSPTLSANQSKSDITSSSSSASSAQYNLTQVLLPGEEIHISWNQTRQDGESVQAGVYKINIQASIATNNNISNNNNGSSNNNDDNNDNIISSKDTEQNSMTNVTDHNIKKTVKDSITITVQ